ncbi:MAG: tRNA (adenosine(37)-N6)-dimethylallyltransferase MiaA [Clostridia bacterium]|nr:tRNA (adenosine(37)-N6)-dimethylallyltransferase MiaA [Clostridia bacterium]
MQDSLKQKIYFIVGPTASGKTAVSIDVAGRMNAEIISADSIQAYKRLDIGSAKPSFEERRGIPHHLMDCVEIDNVSYNVVAYREKAAAFIRDIFSRGKTPLIVGGTGLYVNSLVFPLNFSSAEPNFERRNELAALELTEKGSLHSMLKQIDPDTANRLHINDTKRIIRAIEVYEQTGVPLSAHGGDFSNSREEEIEFEPVMAGITMDRARLYSRIEERIDIMLEQGLLDEVDSILSGGFDSSLPALQGLGYKQLIMFRNGKLGYEEAVELIKRDTRRFAKRQISWFKRDKRIRWFSLDKYGDELSSAVFDYFNGEDIGENEP